MTSNNPYARSRHLGRHHGASDRGAQGVQRSYASQLKEHEPLFNTYEHLQGLSRADAALTMLRKVASMVKPIMRKHGWRVEILAEFLPPEQNLLGLNINKGHKICIRLRFHNNPDLFLPMDQVVDTMLHELSHNVWGEHDSNFHKLWDELRDEYETLARKGYTGEGFLSEGKRLGGGAGNRMPPPHEMRRLARASAEKRKAQGTLGQGSGQRLGGTPLHLYGGDVRQVIADQVAQRNQINRGCASGRADAGKLSDQAGQATFKTKAEEDDANNRAIAQALFELMEQEESQKLNAAFQDGSDAGGLAWSPQHGLYDASMGESASTTYPSHPSEEEQMAWALRDSMSGPSTTPTSHTMQTPIPPNALGFERADQPPAVPLASKPKLQPPDARPTSTLFQQDDSEKDAKGTHLASSTSLDSGMQHDPHSQSAKPEQNLIDLCDEPSSKEPSLDQWACEICTCINPTQFLACDACGGERRQTALPTRRPSQRKQPMPRLATDIDSKERWKVEPRAQPESLGWLCTNCGSFMEHKWWTCSACGMMKASS